MDVPNRIPHREGALSAHNQKVSRMVDTFISIHIPFASLLRIEQGVGVCMEKSPEYYSSKCNEFHIVLANSTQLCMKVTVKWYVVYVLHAFIMKLTFTNSISSNWSLRRLSSH